MTVQVLFVQGAGANAHDDWDSKLVHSLERELGAGYRVRFPLMPEESEPRYDVWKSALLEELESLEDGAILVGHSVGGAVLIQVLAEERLSFTPGAVMLIAAPYTGDEGWHADWPERLPPAPIFVYHGTEDETIPFADAGLYAKMIPRAVVRALEHRDHQLNNDLSEIAADIRRGT